MLQTDRESTGYLIDDIDAMARAAFTWVRQQTFEQRFIGLPVSAEEESDLAAGFLAGLKVRLTLEEPETILLAYVYALMSGERAGATSMAQELINKGAGAAMSCSGYLHGLNAARRLLNDSQTHTTATIHSFTSNAHAFKEH